MRRLTVIEQTFLARGERSLARIATVDEHGLPHVVPGGWHWDADAEELVLTGRNVARTARAAHVRRTGVAAISIDGIAEGPGWSPWAFLARGPAHVDDPTAPHLGPLVGPGPAKQDTPRRTGRPPNRGPIRPPHAMTAPGQIVSSSPLNQGRQVVRKPIGFRAGER